MLYLFSPFIYQSTIDFCKKVVYPVKDLYQNLIIKIRNFHNFSLSVFSFSLAGLSGYEIYNQTEKIICKEYNYTNNLDWIIFLFYWSKYWEWLDTYFLILSDKKISSLHKNHHSVTPFLSYVNTYLAGPTPSYLIAVFLNCLVHGFMYWYYLFPRGFLKRYKKSITKLQILQHIIMVLITIFIYQKDCLDKEKFTIALWSTLLTYSYFLFSFSKFYLKTYFLEVER